MRLLLGSSFDRWIDLLSAAGGAFAVVRIFAPWTIDLAVWGSWMASFYSRNDFLAAGSVLEGFNLWRINWGVCVRSGDLVCARGADGIWEFSFVCMLVLGSRM